MRKLLLGFLVLGMVSVVFAQTPTPGPGAGPQPKVVLPALKAERITATTWRGSLLSAQGVNYQKLEVLVTIKGMALTTYELEPYYEPDSTGENSGALCPGAEITTDANGDGQAVFASDNLNGFLAWALTGWTGSVRMYSAGGTLLDVSDFVWVPVVDRR